MMKNGKTAMVVGLFPDQLKIKDTRLNKPVCFQKYEDGESFGSMLVQDLDSVKIGKDKKVSYFCPNNIAILLSVNSKSVEKAKSLHSTLFDNPYLEFEFGKIEGDKNTFLDEISSKVCI
jgi:hypothetical protein